MQDADEKKFLVQEMMGELIRRKRLEMSYLQEELGIRVGYSPSSAKQAISQIERGAVPVPARKLQNFVTELVLDEQLFRQLAFYLDINDYNEAAIRLDRHIKHQFGYSMLERRAVEQASTPLRKERMENRIARGEQNWQASQNLPDMQPAPAQPPADFSELKVKLQELAVLHQQNLISEEEYERNKQRLLDKYL